MRLASAMNQTIRRFITDEFDHPRLATDHENREENAPTGDYYLLRKNSAVYMYLCKTYKMRQKYSNTQAFFAQEDDGLPLEDDGLVGVLSLKLVDERDEVAVTVLAKMLGTQVCQLNLGLGVVDADLALLYQFCTKKYLSEVCFA